MTARWLRAARDGRCCVPFASACTVRAAALLLLLVRPAWAMDDPGPADLRPDPPRPARVLAEGGSPALAPAPPALPRPALQRPAPRGDLWLWRLVIGAVGVLFLGSSLLGWTRALARRGAP